MATTLATQPCGTDCTTDADFVLTFNITCITLANEAKFLSYEKVLTITWDNNVLRSTALERLQDLTGPVVIKVHCTPAELSYKLKTCPILFNMTAVCDDLGTIRFPMSNCFCDAVMCTDFSSQTIRNDFKFVKDDVTNGTIEVELKIERANNNLAMSDALKKAQELVEEKRRARKRGADDDSEEEIDECAGIEFPCQQELAEHCRKHLAVDDHKYRIINGHLVNVADKRGFCGEICETAMKYCKELKAAGEEEPEVDLDEMFKKKITTAQKIPSDVFKEFAKIKSCKRKAKKDIDKSLEECGINKAEKSTKKKKTKKPKECKSDSTQSLDSCIKARNEFINKMKKKAVGKYSYDFGDTYPFHRSTCSLPPVTDKVPSFMGWRHDKVFEPQKPWRPGKVNRIVRSLMKHFLRPYPYDTISVPKQPPKKHINEVDECDSRQKPTLSVAKRDGEIIIEMRPLKDNKELATDCNPYLNCSPLKFIIKRHPEQMKMHQARKLMMLRGFSKKCDCDDIKCCRCISSIRKEMFREEMKRISQELNMKKEMRYEDVHDSSDSEIDFEFTPPSVTDSILKCKPDVSHTGTQYDFKHFVVTQREKNRFFGKCPCGPAAPGCNIKLKK